jgi:hypothetical protein
VIWRVYVVEAESKEAARGAPCTEEENYLGYFKGDSPSLPDEVSGPFESRETAMNSPEGWVEDVWPTTKKKSHVDAPAHLTMLVTSALTTGIAWEQRDSGKMVRAGRTKPWGHGQRHERNRSISPGY